MQSEKGWLIELRGGSPPRWLYVDMDAPALLSWTTDPNLALRFARESDALAARASFRRLEDTIVTEHVWHGGKSSVEWIVQNSSVFHGQEVETWKSKDGEWGYAYGTELSGVLAAETLVTGFASEEDAFRAANQHCYDSACESAASQGDDI